MCIIAAKPMGVEIPSEEILSNMWENNPDGAGYMYVENKEVKIRKGFMTYDAFKESLSRLQERLDCKATPIVFHFRISTHGGVNPQCCHPFPVSKNVTELKAKKIKTDLGVVHNGIIHSVTPPKDISDTMEYIKSQLYFIKKINPKFYKDDNFNTLIENAIGSKMCFLNTDGEIYTIGNFETCDGMIYSNSTYSYSPHKYYSSSYGYYGWDDYYGYGYKPKSNSNKSDKSKNKIETYSYDYPNVYDEMLQVCDEEDGFLIDVDGNLIETEFALDSSGSVYTYDYEFAAWQPRLDMQAVNHDGMNLKYDESKAILECIIDDWGYYDYLCDEGSVATSDCNTK